MCAYAPVEKYEADFEYNPDWGGSHPVLWLPADWRPNKNNMQAFNLSPWRQQPGTWAGTTAQRNVVTERGRVWDCAVTQDYITFGGVYDLPARWSIEAWVLLKVKPGTSGGGIGKWGNDADGYMLWISTGQQAYAYCDANTSGASDVLSLNVWYHLVATYDGVNATIYVNGTLASQAAAAAPTSTPGTWDINRYEGKSFQQAWQIGEVAYWHNNYLTPAQIRLLYESSLDGSPGVKARPIRPRWFPAAVAGGYTVPLQLILECAQ